MLEDEALIILQPVVPKFERHAQDQYLCVLQSHGWMFLSEGVPCKCTQSSFSIFGDIVKMLLLLNTIELHKINKNYVRH